jgi:hypothetical protein
LLNDEIKKLLSWRNHLNFRLLLNFTFT